MKAPTRRVKGKRREDGAENPPKAMRASPAPETQMVASDASLAAPASSPNPTPCATMEKRPFAKLLLDAINAQRELVQLPRSEPIIDAVRVPITSGSLQVEACPGSLLPPILELPGIVVGASTTLALRHLCLRARAAGAENAGGLHPLIEVRSGGFLELADCRLEGAGLKLHPGASARLIRTRISGSRHAGVSAVDTLDLSVAECEISNCNGEGLHATSVKNLRVSDCTFSNNMQNGALVDGRAGESSFSGCTLSANGQFGLWVDSGCSVSWSRNLLVGNTLGEVGGRGSLDQSAAAFAAGDACMVWIERVGEWVPAKVLEVKDEAFLVLAEVQTGKGVDVTDASESVSVLRRTRQKAPEPSPRVKTEEIQVPADAVRLPKSSEEAPPVWSKKLEAYRRRKRAFLLFLREGGKGAAAWKALDPRERGRIQAKARKEHRDKLEAPEKGKTHSGVHGVPFGEASHARPQRAENRVQRPARKSAVFTRTKHRI